MSELQECLFQLGIDQRSINCHNIGQIYRQTNQKTILCMAEFIVMFTNSDMQNCIKVNSVSEIVRKFQNFLSLRTNERRIQCGPIFH